METADLLRLIDRRRDDEGTTKYLWELGDGRRIESVFFSHHAGPGQCLSTQTGCSVGCRFCATALQRRPRNLNAAEIVAQARAMDEDLRNRGQEVDWVFTTLSGMGEPLLNYDSTVAAAEQLYRWADIDIVSATTSGVVPKIRRLADEPTYVQLHVSLHATDDETRSRLIPTNRKYDIAAILAAAEHFARTRERTVVVNYLLFEGINDNPEDLRRLVGLLDPTLFEVHLLQWNAIEGFDFARASDARVAEFKAALVDAGLTAKPMPSLGRSIRAGCGQLLAEKPTARRRRS